MSDTLTNPAGTTGQLCTWVDNITLSQVPPEIQTRAKYLILDGLACLLVGAHLPWSEKAVKAILAFEAPGTGPCNVYGWDAKISPLQAGLLNSSFVQGFELDDWHSEAPLHSNSLYLPALFAAAEQEKSTNRTPVSGAALLLATIVGYEVGPRVGRALHGPHILTTGWHSGAVFGPPAIACAVSKLLGMPPNQTEDALGIACTQACGLMSAQFGSEVKRMQHGFAVRNGLLAALLARGGYVGIKKIFEQPYGGFLNQFTLGNGKIPQYLQEEVSKELGQVWKTNGVNVKPYASMAFTHPTVDCIRKLQEQHPDLLTVDQLAKITKITIEMEDAAFQHGGWNATRLLTATGAQMNCAYVGATQLVDSKVLAAQFQPHMLDRDDVWDLVGKTTCVLNSGLSNTFAQRLSIEIEGNTAPITAQVDAARGLDPPISNQEIVDKWRYLTEGIIEEEKRDKIEEMVLNLDNCKDMTEILELMTKVSPLPGN